MTVRRYLDQRLRLPLLRVMDAVATHGSLLKAAAALGVSQPALTKSLRELEDLLQIRLLHRHSRGVEPTAAGMVFVRSARRVLAELRRLDEELDELSGPGGTVALGALPVAAAGVLPGALVRLKATHPDVKVRLRQGRTEELLPLLASGELDLIVGRLYEPAVPDGFAREPLWTEPISVLARAGHPMFSRTYPSRLRSCAATTSCCPPLLSASGRRSSTCSRCLISCRRHRCARAPTASSAKCYWRRT